MFYRLVCLTLLIIAWPQSAFSQIPIVEDGTVGTSISTSDNINFTIGNGSISGRNLFHSFSNFSVPSDGSVYFDNAPNITNIFSRVTGQSISSIDGLIRANNTANLFLINPNGIVIGPSASLDIGGSFLLATAEQINFDDGSFFSSNYTSTATSVLTISTPIGLQFGASVGDINAQPNSLLITTPQNTLALIGGDISLREAGLFAPDGRLELGSVAAESQVSLAPAVTGWSLGYENVQAFQDIILEGSFLGTTDFISFVGSGDDVLIRGRNISLLKGTQITNINANMELSGARISLIASDDIEVNNSVIGTDTFSTASAGDIELKATNLKVVDTAFIDANSTFGSGSSGNLIVQASELIEIDGSGSEPSRLTTQTFTDGDAGTITISSKKLLLSNDGQILSSTLAAGNGGDIFINVSDYIEVRGNEELLGFGNILSQTQGQIATGDSGSIHITTQTLKLSDEGRISVAAIDGSQGQAGALTIIASDSVLLSGTSSSISAESQSSKPAGNILIDTQTLIVEDGATVSASTTNMGAGGNLIIGSQTVLPDIFLLGQASLSVSATGAGQGGDIVVTAQNLSLDQGSTITASTASEQGGNLLLDVADVLQLRGGSQITATAGLEGGNGGGGNITIPATFIITDIDSNNDITANAFFGIGGNIEIIADGVFGFFTGGVQTPFSDITATSERNLPGTVTVTVPEVDPTRGLVQLPATVLDPTALTAQTCSNKPDILTNDLSQFLITGRGGISPSPSDLLGQQPGLANWVSEQRKSDDLRLHVRQNETHSSLTIPVEVIEAQSWRRTSDGHLMLIAKTQTLSAQVAGFPLQTCRG